MKSSTQTLQII